MSNFHSSKSIILKGVRLVWADIFTPGDGMNGGPPKFKVSATFEKGGESDKLAKAAMIEAARGLWGDNAINVIKSMGANSKAVRNGDDKLDDKGAPRSEYAGLNFISCSNKSKPQIVGPKRIDGKFVHIMEDGSCQVDGVTVPAPYKITVPYRGCYVNLKVQMIAGKAFQGKDKQQVPNQVYAKLEAIQFVRDGEAFGAGPSSAEGFDDEEVEGGEGGSSGASDDDFF